MPKRDKFKTKNLIGVRLKELRKQNNLSQRELADKLQLSGLDIDKNVVTRIETGKRYVADFELRIIAQFFGVTYNYLIDGNTNGAGNPGR